MKIRAAIVAALSAVFLSACGSLPVTDNSVQATTPASTPAASATSIAPASKYYPHTDIIATMFYGGELPSEENGWQTNTETAYCIDWNHCFGGVDDPVNRTHNGAWPVGFQPKENPFYVSLPCNEFNETGDETAGFKAVKAKIPWEREPGNDSMLKNRWVRITHDGKEVFAQINETGPFATGAESENDCTYVFSDANRRPKNKFDLRAGIDVSPATALALGLDLNAGFSRVNWIFVDFKDVKPGPWKEIISKKPPYWEREEPQK